MSAAAVNDLVLLVTALLLTVIVRVLTWLPRRWLYLKPEAERVLRELAAQFQNDLREGAAASPRVVKRKKMVKRDIKAEYYRRRQWPGKVSHFLDIIRKAAGGITFGVVVFVVAVLALPFLAGPFPVVAGTAGYAGPPLAALGLVVAATKFLDKSDGRGDALPVPSDQQRSGSTLDAAGEGSDPVAKALERHRERVTRAVRKHALSTAVRERGRRDGISKEEIARAWGDLVIPRLDAPAPSAVRSRRAWIVSVATVLIVATPIYSIFVLAIPKLSLSAPWRLVVTAVSLLIIYGLMRAVVGAWRHREALLSKLVRAASVTVDTTQMARPHSETEADTTMSPDKTRTASIQPPAPESPDTTTPAREPGGGRRPPDSRDFDADLASDFLMQHYLAHKEHAGKVNDYRSQAMTILASGFAPVAGSLIALAATGKFSNATRFALVASLLAFGLITLAMALWAGRLDKLQQHYRQAMDTLAGDAIDEWLARRQSQREVSRDTLRIAAKQTVMTQYGLLAPALTIVALSAFVLASLLAIGIIAFSG